MRAAAALWSIEEVDEEDEVAERIFLHETVMAAEVTEALAPVPGGTYVDVTLGGGGHAEAILEAEPSARVIGLDRDPLALAAAAARLERFGARFVSRKSTFSELGTVLLALGIETVDGLVADLGVSSPQIDDPARGMSFRAAGPLDMRMDPTSGETVGEMIARLSSDELADVIFHYGDERRSRRIARCIKQADEAGELATTLDLRRAVVRAVGPARVGGVDPATRTFQALRIAVNGELSEIEALLVAAPFVVREGGILAMISFHSLEDRLVKRATRERTIWEALTKKPLVPSDEECARNPRSRSAKLRTARRLERESDEEGPRFIPSILPPSSGSRMRTRHGGRGE